MGAYNNTILPYRFDLHSTLNTLNTVNLSGNIICNKVFTYKSLYSSTKTNKLRSSGLVSSKGRLIFGNSDCRGVWYPLFYSYMRVNIFTSTSVLGLHPSWNGMYLYNKGFGISVRSLNAFFRVWKGFYLILFNLLYFKLSHLTFGTIFFKNEVESLNWNSNASLKGLYRYVKPFLTLRSTKIFNQGWVIFYMIKLRGCNTALIIDTLYHKKTLYYLNIHKFYQIGIVPTNLNANSVDVALPTSSDSTFTQLFFIRFFLQIKQSSAQLSFENRQFMWKNFN